jgi:hypothetical protein
VLISRLSHFLAVHGIISREQVGFLWRHAAEEHVFTLTQSLKARLRAGASTHVLFVDLRKAYDKVHLATLWRVLEVVGVPDRIVALLRGMAAVRTTQVRVNGELSEPIPYEAGVPQGDPLSCHLMMSGSQTHVVGLRSPSTRMLQLKDAVTTAVGFRGGLCCRAGVLAPTVDASYLDTYVASYMQTQKAWYEALRVGISGGDDSYECAAVRAHAVYLKQCRSRCHREMQPACLVSYDRERVLPEAKALLPPAA